MRVTFHPLPALVALPTPERSWLVFPRRLCFLGAAHSGPRDALVVAGVNQHSASEVMTSRLRLRFGSLALYRLGYHQNTPQLRLECFEGGPSTGIPASEHADPGPWKGLSCMLSPVRTATIKTLKAPALRVRNRLCGGAHNAILGTGRIKAKNDPTTTKPTQSKSPRALLPCGGTYPLKGSKQKPRASNITAPPR